MPDRTFDLTVPTISLYSCVSDDSDTSQMITPPEESPDASLVPSRENDTLETEVPNPPTLALYSCVSDDADTSQMITAPEESPDASLVPSGENETLETEVSDPPTLALYSCVSVGASQRTTWPLPSPDTMNRFSGETATEYTPFFEP